MTLVCVDSISPHTHMGWAVEQFKYLDRISALALIKANHSKTQAWDVYMKS